MSGEFWPGTLLVAVRLFGMTRPKTESTTSHLFTTLEE